jgi:nitrilase
MKVAALQMVSTPDVDENLATARRLVAQAAQAGAELVALPEYFCLMGRHDDDKLKIAEAPGAGPIQAMLAGAAQAHGVWVIGGTLPMRIAGNADRVRNACCVYAPGPEASASLEAPYPAHARYDKIHLFRFDNGTERYDEGRVLEAGDTPMRFDAGPLRVGLSVCYDVRFPELYRALATSPDGRACDLIAVPAAFTHTTGMAHWELLLRARAVENQCYVIAPAQGGRHENGRRTWGHSLIVDPWGEVLALQAEGEGVVMADLDLDRLAEVRRNLPALTHRTM